MTNQNNQGDFEKGKKPRNQIMFPQMSYIVADQWIDYLGYEQFGWWMKFQSYVNRQDDKYREHHIPYTLESVYKDHLKVSETTFYRKIKVLWECGLINIIEYEPSERKAQKPKNIIVYEYPFHEIERKYKPLEKLRDWKKDYKSESKLLGMKGAQIKKEKAKNDHPPKIERVENKPVDNVDNYPPKSERVHPPKIERVTLPELGANHLTNNLFTNTNNHNHITNNSLSKY